jgi:hypothetical protein
VRYKLTLLLGISMVAGLAQNTVLPGKELDLIQLAIQTGDFQRRLPHLRRRHFVRTGSSDACAAQR